VERPAFYVPMAVSVCPSVGMTRQAFDLPEDAFLFLFAFDYWSWLARKNPRACIEAFRLAFPRGDEPVGLVLKTKNVHGLSSISTRMWDEVRRLSTEDTRIKIIEQDMSDHELHDLMRACDAYMSLHRAEGFGFSLAEAMLLGKPVVTTNYSGNMEFTHDDN